MLLSLTLAAAILTQDVAVRGTSPSPGDCRPASWKPSSRGAQHADLWKSAGRELPRGDQQVLIYSAGGHHIRFVDSIVATRERSGTWRLARVTESISDVPPPPGQSASAPTLTFGERILEEGAALELERVLNDPSLDQTPAVCFPVMPPSVGEAQSWLDVSWAGRTHVFEMFGVPANAAGELVEVLLDESKTINLKPSP